MSTDGLEDLTIERTSTAGKIAEVLRVRIMRGDIAPGTPLTEGSLASNIGVSRNTVREGIRRLVAEGLLQHEFQRGVTVTRTTSDDVREIFDIRRRLEVAAIRESGEELCRQLAKVVQELEEEVSSDNAVRLVDIDLVFHQTIVDSLGNARLSTFFANAMAVLRLALFKVDMLAQDTRVWIRQHSEIVGVLESGDRRAAAKLMEKNLHATEKKLMGMMALE